MILHYEHVFELLLVHKLIKFQTEMVLLLL
jgi:hypothetical protein